MVYWVVEAGELTPWNEFMASSIIQGSIVHPFFPLFVTLYNLFVRILGSLHLAFVYWYRITDILYTAFSCRTALILKTLTLPIGKTQPLRSWSVNSILFFAPTSNFCLIYMFCQSFFLQICFSYRSKHIFNFTLTFSFAPTLFLLLHSKCSLQAPTGIPEHSHLGCNKPNFHPHFWRSLVVLEPSYFFYWFEKGYLKYHTLTPGPQA